MNTTSKILSGFLLCSLLISSCKKEEIVNNISTLEIPQAASGTNRNLKYGKVTDIDGNTYRTIQIGKQIWMADNLKVSRYRNGNAIAELKDVTPWSSSTTGAWCYYNNDPFYNANYGKLYNWYAISDVRGLAPKGWHVPTSAEWLTLISNLGGETIAGGKLKSTTLDWTTPNIGATNSSGFSGSPAGYRHNSYGTFGSLGDYGNYWSSTATNSTDASYYYLCFFYETVGINTNNKAFGFSIRCIKD
jgi:uncharacterized protein (TIGR02145 family)